MRHGPKTPDKAADLLLVFARAPVPGRCKTRLISALGRRGAARIHRRLTDLTLRTALAGPGQVELHAAPHAGHGFLLACRRRQGLQLRRQAAGDLGRKMGMALAGAFRKGARRVLIVGTDCPALRPPDLAAALEALDRHDAVIKPARDGGYVLIGSRRPIHSALRAVDWSSGRECRQTLGRLQRRDLSCAVLPTAWDVDRPVDLRRARQAGLL